MSKLFTALFPNYTCVSCKREIAESSNPYLCEKCMAKLPFCTDTGNKECFAPFMYEDPIRKMILELKYSDNGFAANAIAPYMSAVFMKKCPKRYKKYTIIPVPLCKSRLRRRGYNQSELLAKQTAAYLNLPVLTDVLLRTKKTVPQKKMTHTQRAENLKNAFAVQNADLITGKYILLIDDVRTTGATAKECAAVLRQAGAKQVKVLTAAAVAYEDEI
jgi:ComF family protein